MTQAKKVAHTLQSILENPIMETIQDRSKPIESVIDEVISWWRFDMFTRKPGPAYVDETFVGTDLDLACFLFELSERNAVINIPQYKSIRARKIKEGEAIISSENRHGNVIGLTANKDVFSFSLKIKDMNVVTSDTVGNTRNFSITDLDGDMYPGFGNLEFLPTAKENKFIFENQLAVDNNITFKNFVHPNRWSSIFGQYYFITKALVSRLKEESSYYFQEVKQMLAEGINYPPKDSPDEWPDSEKIPGKKIKVKSFEVEIDIPENDSKYPKIEHTVENLIEITKKRKYFTFHLTPKLNFAIRTVEYAYYKYGNDRIPSWLQNVTWERDYVTTGKRTKWDRVILFQPAVGQIGVSLKKRIYETTQEVGLDYDNRKGKLKNYVAIVLDESGSMGVIQNEVVGAFNQQVQTIKQNAHDMETSVSLVKFNTIVDKPKLWNVSELKLNEITEKDYRPTGLTALNDAVAMTIDKLDEVEDKDDPLTSFLLIVITDGEENCSKRYPGTWNSEFSNKLKSVQERGNWTITFLGANQDMNEVSKNLHIPKGNVTAFSATAAGVAQAGFNVTMGLNSYYTSRRAGETTVRGFYQDSNSK